MRPPRTDIKAWSKSSPRASRSAHRSVIVGSRHGAARNGRFDYEESHIDDYLFQRPKNWTAKLKSTRKFNAE